MKKTPPSIGLALCLGLVAIPGLTQGDAGRMAGGADKPPAGPPPNVLLVVCDDLGLGDLACYGNPVVKTPNLDRLAGAGIRFTHCYAAAPICGPSRVSLLTGRYHERSGYRMTHEHKDSSLDEPWLARQLQSAGYTTGAFGKWHVGESGFKERGFDQWSITSLGGWADYYRYSVLKNSAQKQKSDGTYATDFITTEAMEFMTRQIQAGKPFFAYIAYTAPHFPLQAPEEEIAPYRDKPLENGTKIVYGMISRMDKGVGRILDLLDRSAVRDNTLIIFTSDNGPWLKSYKGLNENRFNGELAGQKGDVLEGGIRVPGIMAWPREFGSAGRILHDTVTGLDWTPTILAAAAITPAGKPFDGLNLLAALKGGGPLPARARFWCYNKAYLTSRSNAAMRDGDWKLYRPLDPVLNRWDNRGNTPDNPAPTRWQLFNIAGDPKETRDLAGREPGRLAAMMGSFDSWWNEVLVENVRLSGPPRPTDGMRRPVSRR
jgi:arylsulfatase A-like enzyme